MSFWEKKLGVQPVTTSSTARQINTGGPWWRYQPVPEVIVQQPQEPQHDFSKAMHLKRSSNCPQCGSGDYMTLGQVSSRSGSFEHKRCFACGYPAVQSMSGMASISNKPGQPTKQVSMMNITNDQGRILGSTQAASGTASTYNPTDVRAGRIG